MQFYRVRFFFSKFQVSGRGLKLILSHNVNFELMLKYLVIVDSSQSVFSRRSVEY